MASNHPDLGFQSIGNATILAFDHSEKPVLVTDPWISESAYFGSWGQAFEIPDVQRRFIENSQMVWFSHGHPDHLNMDSLEALKGKKILLPDHVGGRIARDPQAMGFETMILEDRKWYPISKNIKILCIADYNQDAVILMDIGGTLVVNLNDSHDHGWMKFVKSIIAQYKTSYLLALSGYGDADMIHYFDESGRRILPAAASKFPVGKAIAEKTEALGCTYFIPSSSSHRYQRTDSIWADEYTTRIEDYANGFKSNYCELLQPFISVNVLDGDKKLLHPKESTLSVKDPQFSGDDWSELLHLDDFKKAESYFKRIEHLGRTLDFINLKVGGRDHVIRFSEKEKKGITFEAPRNSLMTSIQYEIFDDLLIGNFMKTTLHGSWPASQLYPDFTPFVAKYADNGLAKSEEELREHFAQYRAKAGMDYLLHHLEVKSKNIFRSFVPSNTVLFQKAKSFYWKLKA